jgi:hypothetical protein
MTRKKNSFWRLCFSFLPGAGEMYMGFMKMGISTMSLFMAVFFFAVTLEFGALMIVGLVIWFYSFFHVHNLASLPDEEFYSIEDDYIFHFISPSEQGKEFYKNNRRILAYILIFMGTITTWNSMLNLLYEYLPETIYFYIRHLSYDLPKFLAGIGIILLGAAMIRGKKKEIGDIEWEDEDAK